MPALKPFFTYFGSKHKIIQKYPKPEYDLIVEPFAGSAAYACAYPEKEVLLLEIYPTLANLWKWLISVSEDEFMALPEISLYQNIRALQIPQEARDLIGFCAQSGRSMPEGRAARDRGVSDWSKMKIRIASQLHAIRHWQVEQVSYADLTDSRYPATWFIDPPYQVAGKSYKYSFVDYPALASFSKSRVGQVIVCESKGAEWLPFRDLCSIQGSNRKTTEVIWP